MATYKEPEALTAGHCGYVVKGVAVAVVGGLFLLAAQRADAAQATGVDGTVRSQAGLPEGTVLLLVVALGFAAYAVYSLARSCYAPGGDPAFPEVGSAAARPPEQP